MVRPIGVTRQEKVNATTIGYELNRNTNSVAEQRRSDYRDVVVLQGLADVAVRCLLQGPEPSGPSKGCWSGSLGRPFPLRHSPNIDNWPLFA